MANHVIASGAPVLLSATGVVSESAGALLGFFCNSTSTGTIIFSTGGAKAATTGGSAITGTITPAAGTWYPLPVQTPDRMYATIANTLSVTCVFAAG